MHCLRMLYCRKVPLFATLKHISEYQSIIICGTSVSMKPQFRQFRANFPVQEVPAYVEKQMRKGGLIQKFLLRFILARGKYELMALGYYLYYKTADTLNYPLFFKDFNMPDTFYSWFLITELHVWMLMVRYMAEGDSGKIVRNNIVEAMWKDVNTRVNKLGHIAVKIKRKQIFDISYQFNAALIAYDEGILSDDKVLAGALWRRYFCSECNNPEQLEKLLIYVRKQISILDKIPSKDVFDHSNIKWIDLKSIR